MNNEDVKSQDSPKSSNTLNAWLPWLIALIFVGGVVVLWQPLSEISSDRESVRAWVEPLGAFAPVAYFILNVAQIVVAPIPGYPVQVIGGILFGPVLGSICAVGGMVAGGTLAAWLGRKLGRPWLEKRIGAEELDQWREVARIDSFWTWWVILLIPLGDVPYFFAGLGRIRLLTFALAILTSRGPFTVLIVILGDRVLDLPLIWVALVMAAIGLIVIIGFSQSHRLEQWGRAYVNSRANKENSSKNP